MQSTDRPWTPAMILF